MLKAFILMLYALSPAAVTWLTAQSIAAMSLIATVLCVCLGARKMKRPPVTSQVSVSDTLWTEHRQGRPATVFTLNKGGMLAPFGILVCLKNENGALHRRWILPGECDDKATAG